MMYVKAVGLSAACVGTLLASASWAAVVTPAPSYTVGFDDASATVDFIAASNAGPSDNWTVQSGAWRHSLQVNNYSPNVSSQTVQTSGVVGNSFTLSTDFTMVSKTQDASFLVGLAALSAHASQNEFGDASESWYAASVRINASGNALLDMVQNTPSNYGSSMTGSGNGQDAGFAIALGTQYHLSVTGTYDELGQLILSTTLTDVITPANTFTVTTAAIATPKTGVYFGYREEAFASNTVIDYDNFSLSLAAVPEPLTASLLACGALALLRRKR